MSHGPLLLTYRYLVRHRSHPLHFHPLRARYLCFLLVLRGPRHNGI